MEEVQLLGGNFHGESWTVPKVLSSFITLEGDEYFRTRVIARPKMQRSQLVEVFCTEPEEAQTLYEDMLV